VDSSEVLYREAMNLFHQGHDVEAESILKQIIGSEPDHTLANFRCGLIAARRGEDLEAYKFYKNALQKSPQQAAYPFNFATICSQLGRYDEAEEYFRRTLEIQADLSAALNGLALVNLAQGNLTDAEDLLLKALKKNRKDIYTLVNLGNIYIEQGFCEKAFSLYEDVVRIQPDNILAVSNKLLCMLYPERWSAEEIFTEHLRSMENLSTSLNRHEKTRPNKNKPAQKRPLRVGYVSADFRSHSVAYFFLSICAHHNRENVKVYCYYNNNVQDLFTSSIRRHADEWRSIYAKSDENICRMVIDDEIDILVDLNGHTSNGVPLVFMLKPAPVQVSYLGYPCTTGIKSIDYRLTDSLSDPLGEDEFYTEQLIRIPGSFLCYYPPPELPDLAEPPVFRNNYITFGSFNNLTKISESMVGTWAKILLAVPDSRFVIKAKPLKDKNVIKRLIALFEKNGIGSSRITFLHFTKTNAEHLSLYNSIDISLDTFPYNGTTTTLESLIMGVPVVVLKGKHHRERVGFSILSNIGCHPNIAESIEKYCSIAVGLSSNIDLLAELRRFLRHAVLNSSLCDGPAFVRKLESAYREMWIKHCRK
jgi:predicted O-linked N-acetylglucosamine transferase (SPINDLY family)